MRRLIVRPEAEADITEAAAWHEDREVGLGLEFLRDIQTSIQRALNDPETFLRIRKNPEVRRILTKRFPYRVFFILRPDALIVFARFMLRDTSRSGKTVWRWNRASSTSLQFAEHGDGPEEADGEEGQEVDEEVPAAVAGWGDGNVGEGFGGGLRSFETHTHLPELFGVKVYLGTILNLRLQVFTRCGVSGFRQAAVRGLDTDLYTQVRGKTGGICFAENYEEQTRAHVRIGPD